MKITLIVIAVALVVVAVWSAVQYWYVHYKIERPEYTVVEEHDGYEIREYAPYIVAQVDVSDDDRALNSGFTLVADYIFGNNTKTPGESEGIAMTSPVLSGTDMSENIAMTSPVTDQENSDGTRTVSFIMPSKYTLEDLPTPNNDRVSLEQVPAQRWAVLSFSGFYSKAKQERLHAELEAMLERDGIDYTGEWQFAGYDPPSTLPFLRTNEIWIKLP